MLGVFGVSLWYLFGERGALDSFKLEIANLAKTSKIKRFLMILDVLRRLKYMRIAETCIEL